MRTGSWLECFVNDHAAGMTRYPYRFMVLLIDFDGHPERLEFAKAKISEDLEERVFVLGVLSEPERLRGALSLSYESIGACVAQECHERTDTIWRHELLSHNASELERLNARVAPSFFLNFLLSLRAKTRHDP